MAYLSNEPRITEMLEIAAENGRVVTLLSVTELLGRFGTGAGYVEAVDSSGAFAVYYSFMRGQWCLNRIGPVLGRGRIPRTVWNYMPKPEPEWTPTSRFEKTGKPSDLADVGAFVIGMVEPEKRRVALGRVVERDAFGYPARIDLPVALPESAAPRRWMVAKDQAAAESLFGRRLCLHATLGHFGAALSRIAKGKPPATAKAAAPVARIEASGPVAPALVTAPAAESSVSAYHDKVHQALQAVPEADRARRDEIGKKARAEAKAAATEAGKSKDEAFELGQAAYFKEMGCFEVMGIHLVNAARIEAENKTTV